MKKFFFLAPLVICLVGIISIIAIADNRHLPSFLRAIYDFPFGDKVGHFILFGIFSFTANLALSGLTDHKAQKSHFIILNAAILAAVTIEEFSQLFLVMRNFSLFDLFSGYAGIVCFAILAQKACAKMRRERGTLTES